MPENTSAKTKPLQRINSRKGQGTLLLGSKSLDLLFSRGGEIGYDLLRTTRRKRQRKKTRGVVFSAEKKKFLIVLLHYVNRSS